MSIRKLSIKERNNSTLSFFSKISLAVLILTAINFNAQTNSDDCFNGLSAALEYNAFVHYGVTVASGDTEGPMAMGGDLTLDGTFTVAAHTGGTFYDNNETEASSLVVNGKIIYKSNHGINLNNGFAKIGDISGSSIYDKDNNNVTTNTRITPGGYEQTPRILLQRNQEYNSINADIIDFDAAFDELNETSETYSLLANNITIENGNKITLADNTTNVLNITGDELNNLTNFTFNNKPTTDAPLIVNVDYEGEFVWHVQNQAGIGDQQGAFILYNFYNSSKITLNSGTTLIGTLLAPSSHVIKKSSDNINGQVIAQSYEHLNGELHQHAYDVCEDIEIPVIGDGSEGNTPIVIGDGSEGNTPIVIGDGSEGNTPIVIGDSEGNTPIVIGGTSEGNTPFVIGSTSEGETSTLVDPCLNAEYDVNFYPNPVQSNGILNIDIAINKDQTVNYSIHQLSGKILDNTVSVNLAKGCNTINIDLNNYSNLANNTLYVIVVNGNGWVKSTNFLKL